MKINNKVRDNVTQRALVNALSEIVEELEEDKTEVIYDFLETFKSNDKDIKTNLEIFIESITKEELIVLEKFISKTRNEMGKLELLNDYEATFKFYNESEEMYNKRITEIMNRLEGNPIEKNLAGYFCSILEITGQSDPKNPIIIESSIIQDLLEPIVIQTLDTEDIVLLSREVEDRLNKFFNSDYLYSPFKTTDGEDEYRLVTPTPEIYTLISELPNPLLNLTKQSYLKGEAKIDAIDIIPYDGKEQTKLVFQMKFKGEKDNNNFLVNSIDVTTVEMTKIYLVALEDIKKAKELLNETFSNSIANKLMNYMRDKLKGGNN